MTKKEYALYKGDEFIVEGTMLEIAKFRNVSKKTISFFRTPTYKKRCKNSKKRLVLIELEEEDE